VAVNDVLRDIARLAEIEIRGRPAAVAAPVDLQLRDMPLHQILTRVLDRQSFLIVYSGERPVRVVFVGAGLARSDLAPPTDHAPGPPTPDQAPAVVDPSASAATDSAASDGGDTPAAASNRPVTIHGALAAATGTDSMSFSDVTAVAARDPDPAIRAEALRVSLDILEDEPELSKSFLQMLEQRDDDALAEMLTRVAGDNALEIAQHTARETRIEALQLRALAIAQRLEAKR
jgi:hypothetical protein